MVGKTVRETAMRAERQEDQRKKLVEGRHLQQAVVNIEKIENLEIEIEMSEAGDGDNDLQVKQFTLNKLKIAADLRLKLVDKYLPNLKAIEHTGEGGGSIKIEDWLDQLE
jgi:hypothetical protein